MQHSSIVGIKTLKCNLYDSYTSHPMKYETLYDNIKNQMEQMCFSYILP